MKKFTCSGSGSLWMLCQHRWENVAQERPSYGWPSQKRPGIESNQETGRGGDVCVTGSAYDSLTQVPNARRNLLMCTQLMA